jgi:hypothetical protein
VTAPEYVKAMAGAVRRKLREREEGADKKALSSELVRVDRELGNAVDALVGLGKSAAVLARVRDLESRKAVLEGQLRTIDTPPQLVPNVERIIAARIKKLEEAAQDPSGERVRVEAQHLIGNVKVIEEGEHIIAEIDGARLWMRGGTPDVTPMVPRTRLPIYTLSASRCV